MINIVTISGKLCSGKSTLALSLKEHGFYKYALADALKSDIQNLCKVNSETLAREKDRFRPLLQYYGTDIMRWLHGEDYWVSRLTNRLSVIHDTDEWGDWKFVVDDVRFPNELEGLRSFADRFHAVRIDISPQTQSERYLKQYGEELSEAKRTHISETALDNYMSFDQWVSGEEDLLTIKDQVVNALANREWRIPNAA